MRVRWFEAARDRRLRRWATVDPSAVLYKTTTFGMAGHPASDIRIGGHTHVRGEMLLFPRGGKITVGEYCYVGDQTRIWSAASITVGDRVLISHLCMIMDNLTHPLGPKARHIQARAIFEGRPYDDHLDARPIVIEDDVLIGSCSIILRGIRIGRGTIVGAGSVVTRELPAYVVAAGNPARIVRELTEDERNG